MNDRKTPAADQLRVAEQIMREDHAMLHGLADRDRAREIELQLEIARQVMRDRREALRMLAEYDKGLSQPD